MKRPHRLSHKEKRATTAAVGIRGLVIRWSRVRAPPAPLQSLFFKIDLVFSPFLQALQFTAKTVDGADFSGQSLAGKLAVLWFWAPLCPTCRAEAPAVAKAAQTHPSATFLGVAARDQVPAMNQFVATYKMGGFTHLADVDASVWRHFGITEQPAFAFIAADGSAQVVPGVLSEQDLDGRTKTLAKT